MHFIARALTLIYLALIGAALGAAAIFLGVILIGTLSGTSNDSGGLAMGAAGLTPYGGLAGAALGLWLGWKVITRAGRGLVLFTGYGLTLFAAVSVGAWFVHQELTDGDPYEMGKEPMVHIEWRLPEKVPQHLVDRYYRQMMRSSYQNWILSDWWDEPRSRDEGDITILRMKVQIRWRVEKRTFQLWKAPAHETRMTVDLGLPRDPKATEDYGPWTEVEGHKGHAFRWKVVRP